MNSMKVKDTLDTARLDFYRKRRTGFLERLITAYLDEAPKYVNAIRSGLAESDFDALRIAAHTLKSSSANLGAVRLSELCQNIESAALSANTSEATQLISALGPEVFAAEQALRSVAYEQQQAGCNTR